MSTDFSVVAIIAAYNEEDIIGQVLGRLVSQGVDVCFLDHGSTDGTLAEVQPYVGRGVMPIGQLSALCHHSVEELTRVSQELDATNRAVEHLRGELRARTEELQQVQAEMPDQAREIRHLRSALNVRQDEMMRWQAQLEKRGEKITHATDAPASVRGGVAALEGSRRRRWTAPLRVMPRRVRGR